MHSAGRDVRGTSHLPPPPRPGGEARKEDEMRRILIVGGGYAGFYAAWKLEKKLRTHEAEVTLVDPRPYLTYQPFLPEVVAGAVEARHAAVSLRRHLRRTRVVAGKVTAIDHAHRAAALPAGRRRRKLLTVTFVGGGFSGVEG